MWYIHSVEHSLAIYRNGILLHAKTQINPQAITLSKKKSAIGDHILYDYIYVKCPLIGKCIEIGKIFLVVRR